MRFRRPLLFSALWRMSVSGQALDEKCWRDTPCDGPDKTAFPGEWESNIFAPGSRDVVPVAVFDVATREKLSSWPGEVALKSTREGVYFDFGLEVGGVVTVRFEVLSVSTKGSLGLAFTEGADWIGRTSDASSGNYRKGDGALTSDFFLPGNHTYTMPDEKLRGGFRYLTLFVKGRGASVRVTGVDLELSFQPTWPNLRAYGGYFHSSDDLLNRIWYSCAYTLQTNAIHPRTGRAWPSPKKGSWFNDGYLGHGETINTDGAKRDRTVWPGDMGVAIPSSAYSTGDLVSIRNSLQVIFDYQDLLGSGSFPYCGPPIASYGSVTYHMWTMIGAYNYVLFSGHVKFIRRNWEAYLEGMRFLYRLIDPDTDLLKVPGGEAADWGQPGGKGFHTSAQALFYHTLVTGAKLADWLSDMIDTADHASEWLRTAEKVRAATNQRHWDWLAGAFRNNLHPFPGAQVHPQDGNSLAVLFGLVDASSGRAQDISTTLTRNWTPLGPACPELPGEVSTFASSFEVQAHLVAGRARRALRLARASWGWYLAHENGTRSTAVEGYLVNGTFGYRWDQGYEGDTSYTSHAHGWATGPVTALTERVLGLAVVGLAGSQWRLEPQFADLTSCRGGFATPLGRFSAHWELRGDGRGYTVVHDTPRRTAGRLLLPAGPAGAHVRVRVDGAFYAPPLDVVEGSGDRNSIALPGRGGKHRIEVTWDSLGA